MVEIWYLVIVFAEFSGFPKVMYVANLVFDYRGSQTVFSQMLLAALRALQLTARLRNLARENPNFRD